MENKGENKKSDIKIVNTSFIENLGDLYEQVFDNDLGETFFVKYNKIMQEITEVVAKVKIDEVVYKPINNDFIRKGFIYLPSEAKEYDSTPVLLEIIQRFIHKYVDLTAFGEILSSYYSLLSWVYDSFETIPYLKFTGDYGTGKTRALKVIGSICYKPIFAGGAITPSPIFRLIEQFKGTLIIDEADFSNSDHHAEIIKILNCGYTQDMPVLRTEGDRVREPTAFSVFGPKIIATREQYKDLALESRCITELMKGNPREDIPFQLPKEFYKEAQNIRNMLLLFRFRHFGSIEMNETLRIPGIEARVNQVAMPILAIIENGEERERMREFIIEYDKSLKNKRSDELPAQIVTAITTIHQSGEQLTYKIIAEEINKDREEKNGEYKVSPARIGKVNSAILGFDHKRINGRTQLIWDEVRIKMLCNRYGIEYEENKTDGQVNPLDVFSDNTTPIAQEPLPTSTTSTELPVKQEITG